MTTMDPKNSGPAGTVPLASAIAALRQELTAAWWDAQNKALRFKIAPVELTLEAAVTSAGKGSLGVKWWLLELGGEISHEKAITQTIKLTLSPVTLDEQGNVVDVFIDAPDSATPSASDDQLDASG